MSSKELDAAAHCLFQLLILLLELLGRARQPPDLGLVLSDQLAKKLNLACSGMLLRRASRGNESELSTPVKSNLNVAVFGVSATRLPSDNGERF